MNKRQHTQSSYESTELSIRKLWRRGDGADEAQKEEKREREKSELDPSQPIFPSGSSSFFSFFLVIACCWIPSLHLVHLLSLAPPNEVTRYRLPFDSGQLDAPAQSRNNS